MLYYDFNPTKLDSVIYSILIVLRNNIKNLQGVVDVLDFVPEDDSKKKFPFIALGETTTTADDCKGLQGEAITIEVNLWTRNSGRKKDLMITKAIQKTLYENLDNFEIPESMDTYGIVDFSCRDIVTNQLTGGIFLTTITINMRIE